MGWVTVGRLGLAGLTIAAVVSVGQAARVPCPGGTFEVQGGPLLVGAPPEQVDTVTIAADPAAVDLSIGCGPANATKADLVRAAKRATKVRATWTGCGNLAGKIRLRGKIVDDCGRLRGKLRAKGVKRRFDALLSVGPCDPLAAPGAQGCGAGEKCTWVVVQDAPEPLGVTTCVADGVKDLGDSCTQGPVGETTGFDNCKAGLICVADECQDLCGFGGGAAACAAGFQCTRYAGLFANGADDPIAGVCSEGCDPVTQLRGGGDPCPAGQGCYLLTSSTTTLGVCAGAGAIAHGELIAGTVYANSCLPGHQPRRRAEGTSEIECGALCRVTDVYQGVNEADEGGVAPYTCASKGAAVPSDPTDGESCRYWWALEPFDSLSPYSNSVGWCFKHAAFHYDSDGDTVLDAPFPRCISLTTGDVVPPIGNPPRSDAEEFWCTALPDPAALRLDRMRLRR